MLGACVVLSAAGCRHAVYTDYAAFVREPRPEVAGQDYRVGVPDTLAVTVHEGAELRESRHTLGPDGRLWLRGFEPVTAAGRTSREITQDLNDQIAASPDTAGSGRVAVRVAEFASQKVFVFGQVRREGPQPFHGANTVLDAVAEAELNPRAASRYIQVLRPSADGEFRRRLTVDLDAVLQRGDTTLDVVLSSGDVVYVPPTALGSLGLAWDQLFGGVAQRSTPERVAANPPVEPASDDVEAIREAISQLNHQLEALREAQADMVRASDALAARARNAAHHDSTMPPPNDAVVFTTADAERGGAGESPGPRPEGVRFWGP